MKAHILLFALLLISLLSINVFAGNLNATTTLTPDYGSNKIYFYIHVIGNPPGTIPIMSTGEFNISSEKRLELRVLKYDGGWTTLRYNSSIFTFSCISGLTDCSASGYVEISNYSNLCLGTNLSVIVANTEPWTYSGSAGMNCTVMVGSNYITMSGSGVDTQVYMWSYEWYGGSLIWYGPFSWGSYPLGGSLTLACWYLDSNTYINPSTYYLFSQYANTSCNFCITGTSQCSNYDNQTCVSGSYVTTKSCSAGGWSDCGLSSPSQCPSTPFTYTECTSDANCTSDQVCSCGTTGTTPSTFHYVNCAGGSVGTCLQKEGKSCDDDNQCIYSLCMGKDTSYGTCATKCSTQLDCGMSGYCSAYTDIPFTNFQYTCGPTMEDTCMRGQWYQTNYCTWKLSTFCSSNEVCYTGNCKPDCATGSVSRCTIPSYSCYCSISADCSAGLACNQVTYSGPLGTNGNIGAKVCVTGKANGQTCSANDQCASNNCQNGYCCSTGKVCCSLDAQCPSGQVCYTNSLWAGYTRYYSCNAKGGATDLCSENKECTTPPCTLTGGSPNWGSCGGSLLSSTWSYNITPSSYSILPLNSGMTIQLIYKDLLGIPLTGATCVLKWNGVTMTPTSDCLTSFSINLTRGGTNTFSIYAYKSGYETGTGNILSVSVQSPGSFLMNGERCVWDAECSSGRCEFMVNGVQSGEIQSYSCWSNSDCTGGRCLGQNRHYIDNGTTSLFCHYTWDCGVGERCDITTGECYKNGFCEDSNSYMMCAADDGKQACDPNAQVWSCTPTTGCVETTRLCGDLFACNYQTATCSLTLRRPGTTCNVTSSQSCVYGATCWPGFNTTNSYCCWSPKSSDYCCGSDVDCPSGSYCDLNAFVCVQRTGEVVPGGGCISTDQCITDNGLMLYCSNGVCTDFPCVSGQTGCVFCEDINGTRLQLSPTACRLSGYNRTLGCVSSSVGCSISGGSNAVTPPPTTGGTSIETVFLEIVTLMQYVIIAAVFFFLVALFVTGLTVAYGLVKR